MGIGVLGTQVGDLNSCSSARQAEIISMKIRCDVFVAQRTGIVRDQLLEHGALAHRLINLTAVAALEMADLLGQSGALRQQAQDVRD